MTTFARIKSPEKPTISVHADRRISKINRNIYSGFTEHMGRCIYGGIYDPENPNKDLVDSNGFRKDVLEVLRPLRIPVVRYPGGNFCATYHWIDGVGPRHMRPSRPELAWEGVESNQFGTDEFMKWCEALGTEPYLCFNFGTGTLDEAIAWLEYCNSERNTYYANLRRKNGYEKPYGVKYWALGNEMWGPWQIGQMTQEAYAERAHQWAKALKLVGKFMLTLSLTLIFMLFFYKSQSCSAFFPFTPSYLLLTLEIRPQYTACVVRKGRGNGLGLPRPETMSVASRLK